ncbi:MAG: hypothetical protein AAF490_13085 [Chloroflexota bacterium]
MKTAVCEQCNTGFRISGSVRIAGGCPFCGGKKFDTDLTQWMRVLADVEKELIIPFSVAEKTLNKKLRGLAWEYRIFDREDIRLSKIKKRLRPYYIPFWLADIDVQATWSAEFAFQYDGVSASEKRMGQRWLSKEFLVPLYRWDSFSGELTKSLHNLPAIAIDHLRWGKLISRKQSRCVMQNLFGRLICKMSSSVRQTFMMIARFSRFIGKRLARDK